MNHMLRFRQKKIANIFVITVTLGDKGWIHKSEQIHEVITVNSFVGGVPEEGQSDTSRLIIVSSC